MYTAIDISQQCKNISAIAGVEGTGPATRKKHGHNNKIVPFLQQTARDEAAIPY
jgi:hypothetical protein